MRKKLLGERLLETGLVSERQLAQALQAQQSTGEQLGRLLVRLGYLQEDDLLRLLCEDAGIPFSTLQTTVPERGAVGAIPEPLARAHTLLPIAESDGRLVVALADPFDLTTVSSVERGTGRRLSIVGAPRGRILEALDRAYGEGATLESHGDVAPPAAAPAPAPPRQTGSSRRAETAVEATDTSSTAASVADDVFQRAVALGATDIHIEPTPDAVSVRYRLDGILRKGPSFPKSLQAPLLTRIKVLAGLNIAENRLPQDGRMRFTIDEREIDLRISTFPTLHGEDLVLRVLDRGQLALELPRLGMNEADLGLLREVLHRPLGLVLITGPTGSGKTTTLYSALTELNTGERCILTLEDPIEYELNGIRQAQINPRAGLTFAAGLRSMLRHDPDVILVGEIRDLDTAQISLSAAMTGHLVLSTIHTNSASAAIPRLLDMGAEPFALASSLQLVVAQRLIRRLCAECREPTEVPPVVRRRFELGEARIYRSRGCPACSGTGYRGRVAIFEFLPVTDAISTAIFERKSADEIQRLAGHDTLLQAGLARVREGTTTLEELLRVASI